MRDTSGPPNLVAQQRPIFTEPLRYSTPQRPGKTLVPENKVSKKRKREQSQELTRRSARQSGQAPDNDSSEVGKTS